ncbi:MAG: hypothetical protein E6X92_01220 [Clostridiaceae bacterium]|nr:hypothetical protein [Clostridiaceae bacterium]
MNKLNSKCLPALYHALAWLCGLCLGLAGASIGKEVIWHYYEIKNYLNGYRPMRVNLTGEAPNRILIGVCCLISVICCIILHRKREWRVIPSDSAPKRYRFARPALLVMGTSMGVLFRVTGGIVSLMLKMSAMRRNGEMVLGCAASIKELLVCAAACIVIIVCIFFVDDK